MPAKVERRRPKSGPIHRGVLAAGTGGAVLALPLIGATGAHAAEKAAPAVKPIAAQSAQQAAPQAAPAKAKAARRRIRVRLRRLPARSRGRAPGQGRLAEAVPGQPHGRGENASLIFPGMKLTLGAKASGSAAPSEAKKAAPAPKAAPKAAPKKAEQAPKSDTLSADESDAASAGTSAQTGSSEANGSGWSAPLASANVTTQYRASGASWSSGYHTGSDFQAASGTPVLAIGPGTCASQQQRPGPRTPAPAQGGEVLPAARSSPKRRHRPEGRPAA
ncbi:Peptidase OS=Streptomyces microflavus OX=1919 GN=Smic_72360 PE=4 SV=1 [Streptomyces microflavus]